MVARKNGTDPNVMVGFKHTIIIQLSYINIIQVVHSQFFFKCDDKFPP